MHVQHLIEQYRPYLFIAAAGALLAAGYIRRRRRGTQIRSAYQWMGYAEVPVEQVFANPARIAGSFQTLDGGCRITANVARGQSALGDTLAFDVAWGPVADGAATHYTTVVGFCVDSALPDFRISHIETTGDGPAAITSAGTSGTARPGEASQPSAAQPHRTGHVNWFPLEQDERGETLRAAPHEAEHPIAIDDTVFSGHHHVYGFDDAAVRAMLTPAFTTAVANDEAYGDLVAHKAGSWLFVYADRGQQRVDPRDLPRRVSRAAALAQHMNLRPATPAPARITGPRAMRVNGQPATLDRDAHAD